jgi:putative endopeptidase
VQTRLFALTLATLVACGSNHRAPEPPTVAPKPEPPAPMAAENAPSAESAPSANRPKPEIGAWGFDTAGMDRSAAPGVSFFKLASGTWARSTPIPDDKSDFGMFTVLRDRSDERTHALLEAASGEPGTDVQRVGDYYKTFMDEAAIEAKGLAPIKARLDEIARIKDAAGVVRLFAAYARVGYRAPFATGVAQDEREPEHYLANIAQGGLGLPDRDMYDVNAKQFAKVRDAYQKYAAAMFTLIGAKSADKRAAAVYALEEKIAATHWTRVQNRDPQKAYNKLTIDELVKLAPAFDWKAWLKGVGLEGQAMVNVRQPTAIAGTSALVKSEPLAVWKDYLTLQALTGTAAYLPKRFVDTYFEMFGKTLSGTPQLKERWKRAVDDIAGGRNDRLGEAVAGLYVAKYFTPETKARADQLVKNLLTSMGQRLDALAWMGPETKAKAKAKLATYNPKIGYAKKWRDFSSLKVVAGDAVGNALRLSEFEYARRLAKLGGPVDRDEWGMTPMTVNAYYNSTLNEIVFPAAILQPPFFDANADDAVNYGGIGAVIGHEISHGFDDRGSQFDASGALKNWWTKEDNDKFKVATAKLVAQYSAYCPIPAGDGKPAQCVKGELTLGENIADLAGLTVAYNAYKLALGGKPAPVIDGFTGDQRFFLGWAQVWRHLYRGEQLANLLVTDPHSPAEYRTSVVRNLDAWYDAFKPRPGDPLYLAPDQRVKIW